MRGWLQSFGPVRRVVHRWGPSYWRLPRAFRRKVCFESGIRRLKGARVFTYGQAEQITGLGAVDPQRPPTRSIGRMCGQYRLDQPFVAELPGAWLVGRHATPFTANGRMLLTAFRDEPRMATLEPHPDLLEWVSGRGWTAAGKPAEAGVVCSLVGRLDANYYHWIVEFCGQMCGVRHYEQATGTSVRLLVRDASARFVRESLELLECGPSRVLVWPEVGPARRVSRLIVPSLPGNRAACSPLNLMWLRERFLASIGYNHRTPAWRRVYIARRAGGWRSIRNDAEVSDYMARARFEVLHTERLTLVDQVRLFSEASVIVGLHGAGLTNLLFAPRASVIEIRGSYGGGEYYSMSRCLGNPYTSLACETMGDDVIVDLVELGRALDQVNGGTVSATKKVGLL
jgi:hypothetical protein